MAKIEILCLIFAAELQSVRIAPVPNINPVFEGVNTVRNFLENLLGKEVDVQCSGVTLSGKVTRVAG
ncbi:MAG: hypothetical protein AAB401_16730, partial [Acidobacteriota bacterium]